MDETRIRFLATLIVIWTGALWGLYWVPVRRIDELGLAGPWGTVAIVGAAAIVLIPFGWRGRRSLARSHPVALISLALGGFAFVLYSVGFLYGRVAIIVILFFLTPVWSTLIGRYLLGWRSTWTRVCALVLGVAGLLVMLGAGGDVPVPRGLGEWLGLAAGLFWSVATVGIRTTATAGPGESAFVFALGAFLGGLVLAHMLEPVPQLATLDDPITVLGWIALAGGLWWAASMGGLMWAATRLDPARVGILLMAEVIIAPISAALIAGERLSTFEVFGGSMVILAGLLEILPSRVAKVRS